MKASELRIGNLINLSNKINEDKIVRVTPRFFCSAISDKDFEITPYYVPIPLTEEWLERFGFEKPAHSWIGDKFHLSEWDNYPLNWCVAFNENNAILFGKLKYIHQLQNLYFALTGKELELI